MKTYLKDKLLLLCLMAWSLVAHKAIAQVAALGSATSASGTTTLTSFSALAGINRLLVALGFYTKAILFFLFSFGLFFVSNAQITETFESRTVGTSTFTNTLTFNLTPSASYKVATLPGNFGYLSSVNWIENTNANPASITSTSNFTAKSLYLYPSENAGNTNQTVGVSVTLTGKLGGVTQFTYTPPAADFTAADYNNTTNRGFSLVNFATPGHQNTIIDELVIDMNGSGNYFAVDNFTFAAAATLPTVTTPTHTQVSSYLAVMGGNVTAGTGITETGVVWSTSNTTPTIADNKVVASGIISTGVFAIVVQNLPAASTVYYRAYATNGGGTAYSTASNFTTGAAKTINYTDGQNAEFVIGQPDFTTVSTGVTEQKFNIARSGSIDYKNGKLYVVDAQNRRILRFAYPITANNPTAELVFGQPNFTTGTSTTAAINTLGSLSACFVDNTGRLWAVNRSLHRIVWYNNAHSISTNQPNADGVLGQPNFTTSTSATSATGMNLPTDAVVDEAGTLWVIDNGNHRVLKFNKAANKANGAAADGVLGQLNLVSNAQDVTATNLTAPNGLTIKGTTLWVADGQTYTRVLRYDNAAAKANGAAADGVLGQPNFTTNGTGTTASIFGNSGSRGMAVDFAGNLWVNDGANDRTLRFNNAAAKANGAAADGVLGQSNFTTGTATANASGMDSPGGLVFDVVNNKVIIAQLNYHRVSIFSSVAAATPTITNFSPTSGGVDTQVTITGTNFTGASAVTIGGVAARSYTVVNATTITAVVGDNFTTGLVQVTQGTTATSAALGTPNFTRTSCANTITALVATPSNDANGFAGFDLTWTNGGTYTAINVFYQPQSGAGSTYFTRRTFAGGATSGRLWTGNGAGITYNIYVQGVCNGNAERVSTTANAGGGFSCSIIGLPGTPLTTTGTDITFTWNTVPNAYLYQPIYQECDAAGNRVAGGGQTGTAYLTPAMTATQSWTVSQLKPNTFYRFAVRVHCLQGNSNLISPYSLYPFIQTGGSGTTCLAPSPTLGSAGMTNGYASQVINWAALPSATNGYGIYFRENSQPDWTTYHLGNVLTYTISGLKQGATYTYFVYGACSNGQAPRSAELTFTAGAATLNCNASTTNASVGVSTNPVGATLSWTTTPNAVQAGKLYGIVYNAVSTPGTTYVVYTDNVSQTLSAGTHPGIVANTNYAYRLQTFCDSRLQWANTSGTFNVPPASSAEKAPQPPTGGVTPQGLQALAGLVDLQVYPNPTDSKLSVELGLETASKVGIKLTDAAGRIVFNENVSSNDLNFSYDIDMKNLASGVYLLMVNVEGKTTVKRVVKQ